MTFILPTALNLHRDTANDNVGTISSTLAGGINALTLRSKAAGNLPLTEYASRIQYESNATTSGGFTTLGSAQGVFFGTDDQTTLGELDALYSNPLLLIWSVQFNSPNRIQVADIAQGGVRLWVGSGSDPTTDYREYYIGGNDTSFASAIAGPVTICVDLNSQSYDAEHGYFDPEDISAYGIATVHESISGTQFGEIHCQRAFLMETNSAVSTANFTSKLPFFLTNPIVSPETFASALVEITTNGLKDDTLSVSVGDFAYFSYTVTTSDADGTKDTTAASFVTAWNASTDSDVSQYTASSVGGVMTFTNDTAVDGEVLVSLSSPMGTIVTTDSAGDTGVEYYPAYSTDFDQAVKAVQGVDYSDKIGNWLTKVGKTFFIPTPFAFGDGVNPCSFYDNEANVESPTDNGIGQKNFRIEDSTMSVFLRLRTTYATGDTDYDSVYLGGTYTWGTPAPWNFEVDSTESSCTLAGNFNGMGTFTLGSCVAASGTFNLDSNTMSKVVCQGADMTDITINGGLTIKGNSVTSFTDVDCSGEIDFDTAGTYSFSGGSLGYFTNNSGGNIVINLTSSVLHDDYNSDSTITVNQATKSLTLTGLQNNTEVRVYNSSGSEIGGIENSGTTFTMSLTDNLVDVVVHNVEYEYLRLSSVDTTATVSIPIQQRFDRGYRT